MNFYIADCHFGHTAVLRFDHRPFDCVEEMEEIMVMNWNAVVRPGDTVYILGDFCWGKSDEWLRILRRLKGNKVLIEGDHDLNQFPPELREQFADIKPYKEIVDNGHDNANRKVIMSHFPIPFYKHSNNFKYFMLCGHVHNTGENAFLEKWIAELKETQTTSGGVHVVNCGQIYNVGAMMPGIHYTPRTLDEIIRGREAYLQNTQLPLSNQEI